MEECFKLETERLKKSWLQYDRATLRNYLVEDVDAEIKRLEEEIKELKKSPCEKFYGF